MEYKFELNNKYDIEFFNLVKYVDLKSKDDIYFDLIKKLEELKKVNYRNYISFVTYYSKYDFWGFFKP